MLSIKLYIDDYDPITGEEVDEITIQFPSVKQICDDCRGEGTTYLGWTSAEQPAFTREDFAEDPDFAEDYMAGRYDSQCPTCNGLRVVDVPDEDAIERNAELAEYYEMYLKQCESDGQYDDYAAAERRMGA